MNLEKPGLLFVAATLLPLASFVLLLILGGLRLAFRRVKDRQAWAESAYNLFGGDTPPVYPAYVATAAIAGAFILCLTGSILYVQERAMSVAVVEDEGEHMEGEHKKAGAGKDQHGHAHGDGKEVNKVEETRKRIHAVRWADRINWAVIGPAPEDKYQPGTARALQIGYRIDSLSCVMFTMVSFIATLIHIFSIGYMSDEKGKEVEDHQVHGEHGHLHRRGRFGRFFLFLSLFCFSMLNLILADNLFQVFVSWELVGVCSYLLVGFYFERHSASTAANKAFITNRVGDAGMLIGLMILWTYVGTFNFQELFSHLRAPKYDAHYETMPLGGRLVRGEQVEREVTEDGEKRSVRNFEMSGADSGSQVLLFPGNPHLHAHDYDLHDEKDGSKTTPKLVGVDGVPRPLRDYPTSKGFASMPYWLLIVAGLGIFLGCVGKSAQFPLQVWLPDAMEGPTPVSALIHAATMVAAGVYLVGRTYPLFTHEVLLTIAYTGGITLFVAATIAVVMTDIKKVLAYSTVSQLGYMMLALGLGAWSAGLFHLVTHAFFKALLFLGSGAVIYGCHHEQEMTKMGGLYPRMKITALTMLVGVLAISGFPGFSGWYSKDSIVAHAMGYASVHPAHALLFVLPLLTAGITTFYMFRMWFMTFAGQPKDRHVYEHAHQAGGLMSWPLIILAVCSICVAWGWPFFTDRFPFIDATSSALHHQIKGSQPHSVEADFGIEPHGHSPLAHDADGALPKTGKEEHAHGATVAEAVHEFHHTAGDLALIAVLFGVTFAGLLYLWNVLDPADAKAQFPGVHTFLQRKWYFDEAYDLLLVRPTLVVANWCRVADNRGIDAVVDSTAEATVRVAKADGRFDLGIVDGLVNLIANVTYAVGGWFRTWQTGSLRNYVLFLAVSAVAIFVILTYVFVSLAAAR